MIIIIYKGGFFTMYTNFSGWLIHNFKYKRVYFPKGKKLFEPNPRDITIHLIDTGMVALYNYQKNGKKTMLRIKTKNDLLGYRHLFEGDYGNLLAMSLTPTYLLEFAFHDRDSFLRENQSAFQYLSKVFINELNLIENRLAQKNALSSKILVAKTLVEFFTINPKYHWKHREVAEYCGIEVETVFRILQQFVALGLIKAKNRKIEIDNMDKLKAYIAPYF